MKKILFLLLCFLFCGCGMIKSANLPGGTSVNIVAKNNIARNIKMLQKEYTPKCSFKFTDITVIGSDQEGAIVEEWRVLSCGKVYTYVVRIKPAQAGDIIFTVSRK